MATAVARFMRITMASLRFTFTRLVRFGEIAKVLRWWFATYGVAVQWFASVLMVSCLGCLLASVLYFKSDLLNGLALLILSFVVLAKIVCAIIFRSDGGAGPRPPLAPVPRPPNGRPPVLSAEAEIER